MISILNMKNSMVKLTFFCFRLFFGSFVPKNHLAFWYYLINLPVVLLTETWSQWLVSFFINDKSKFTRRMLNFKFKFRSLNFKKLRTENSYNDFWIWQHLLLNTFRMRKYQLRKLPTFVRACENVLCMWRGPNLLESLSF